MENQNNQSLAPGISGADASRAQVRQNTGHGWTATDDWQSEESAETIDSPTALRAVALSVQYGSMQALSDVSFHLRPGDTLGLLGLNGAGKSTLLNVLSGASAPHTGRVWVGEHELYENIIEARMRLGYAPDKPAVYPEYRITEYLQFIARMRRIPKAQINQSVNDVLEKCALQNVQRRIIGNLSTGYQQRVNLAQALIHNPRILILDEPTNGLDPVQLLEMRDLIKALSSEQATIFSSHLLSEVDSLCSRVLLIHQGKHILDASLQQLCSEANTPFEIHSNTPHQLDLSKLPGIAHACRLSDNSWIVTGKDMTENHLRTMLTTRGLSDIKITVCDNYLESLFRQLSQHASNSSAPLATHMAMDTGASQ